MAVLEIENLSKMYKSIPALNDVSLTVKRGEFVAIIGRSGAGKSTLLRCINRMIEPDAGRVLVDGEDVLKLSPRNLRRMRAKIGMIFQHYNLVYRQTVIENVLHGRLGRKSSLAGLLGIYSSEEKEHAYEVIVRLGLEHQMHKRCDELSGGQKQRVGIARALVQDPRIILCDEPISSLDPGSSKIIMDQLHRICRDTNMSILVNLHQVDVAVRYADRIIGVKEGCIVYNGSPKKLSKKVVAEIYGSNADELLMHHAEDEVHELA